MQCYGKNQINFLTNLTDAIKQDLSLSMLQYLSSFSENIVEGSLIKIKTTCLISLLRVFIYLHKYLIFDTSIFMCHQQKVL